ncbi:MAG: hypothetical protein LE180_00755, partial [Endomicrobium sp.]|nr:hypothetical protein [Endomicrobium sp.]
MVGGGVWWLGHKKGWWTETQPLTVPLPGLSSAPSVKERNAIKETNTRYMNIEKIRKEKLKDNSTENKEFSKAVEEQVTTNINSWSDKTVSILNTVENRINQETKTEQLTPEIAWEAVELAEQEY